MKSQKRTMMPMTPAVGKRIHPAALGWLVSTQR